MKTYLIQFRNCNYYNDKLINSNTYIMLVYAVSFNLACDKIKSQYTDSDKFINLTIE